jgi:hypothetical protein
MKHLTPSEHRAVWLLAVVLLFGIAGRIWIRSGAARPLPPLPHLGTNPAAGPVH